MLSGIQQRGAITGSSGVNAPLLRRDNPVENDNSNDSGVFSNPSLDLGSIRDSLPQPVISDNTAATVVSATATETSRKEVEAGNPGSVLTEVSLQEDASRAMTLSSDLSSVTRATLVPSSPDFLMSYATLPGSAAFRDTDQGSPYINELSSQLSRHFEIDRALKGVTGEVRKYIEASNADTSLDVQNGAEQQQPKRFQIPFHLTSGMDKLIYL